MRQKNNGLRKLCDCPRRRWPKCRHAWYFNFKPRGGRAYQFSLDAELGVHFETKEKAEAEAERIRSAIRDGTFVRAADVRRRALTSTTGDAPTLAQLGEIYFQKYVSPKTGQPLGPNERYRWDLIMRTQIDRVSGTTVRVGDIAACDVTRHDIEAFIELHREPRTVMFVDRKGRSHAWRRGGLVGTNRCLGRLRAFFAWAVDKDYVEATPFRKGGLAIKGWFLHEEGRERRLEPGEDERLFNAANPHLQAVIVVALETACRIGEILKIQWKHVRFDLNELHLPAKNTKARRPRQLPMSHRLRAVLEMRRQDPGGDPYPPHAYVFGDVTGARVKSVKTAWANAVLKAHGIEPKRGKNANLSPECQAQLAAIDLNFHDLRREAGSSFLEGGMAPHYVQQFLDHAKLSTTSRYLKVDQKGMHAALKRFEAERDSRCNSVVNAPVSDETPIPARDEKFLQ